MKLAALLNAIGLTLGVVGAVIFWAVGKREGPGLPFWDDTEGTIRAQIATQNRRRDSRKNIGMALIAFSFLFQLLALFL